VEVRELDAVSLNMYIILLPEIRPLEQMPLSLSEPAKVARQRLELGTHPLLFHFDPLLASGFTFLTIRSYRCRQERRNIFQRSVARHIERNVGRQQPRETEQLRGRFGLRPRERVLSIGEVLGSAPRRTEKDDIDLARCR
jgi:hypothetical protein